MTALDNYKLRYEYESAENRTAKVHTNQPFRADQATRLGSMANQMGHSLKSYIIRRIKGDNAR
jgi:hypothetical protein